MMAPQETAVKAFMKSANQAAKVIAETAEDDAFIQVFSHLDADGVAAAGIVGKTLYRLDARFSIKVTQWINDSLVKEALARKPQLIVFSDLGSGYLDFISNNMSDVRVVVLDHHQIVGGQPDNVVQVNPHAHGIDGARDISGAGVAYLVSKEIDGLNVDLSTVAIVGALGDIQDKFDQRQLGGVNGIIVKDAVEAGLLTVEKDLIFFGRETRPIHKALASTTNPFIPGISGEEDKGLAFLKNLNIEVKNGDKWRALRDLTDEERKKFCSALSDYLVAKGLHNQVSNLIGHIYVLQKEEPWTPMRDAREFAVLLNATGRMDRPSIGTAVCMGDRGSAFEEAETILEEYRRTINKYLNWVMEKPDRMEELENTYVVNGEDFIDDKIVGAVSSILSWNLQNPEKPLIAYANVREEGLAKISARTVDSTVGKGVDLAKVMEIAAAQQGGKGGGHNIAAGAQVPLDRIDDFVKRVDDLIGKQLKGEQTESTDSS
jgi:single-stranded-DNA-specific exonuclease